MDEQGRERPAKTATHTLKLGADCPTDTVCFHAQQCVEKYLKAALVVREIPFPKTHDIEELVASVLLSEAKEAVKLARRIRREVRKLLEDKPLF